MLLFTWNERTMRGSSGQGQRRKLQESRYLVGLARYEVIIAVGVKVIRSWVWCIVWYVGASVSKEFALSIIRVEEWVANDKTQQFCRQVQTLRNTLQSFYHEGMLEYCLVPSAVGVGNRAVSSAGTAVLYTGSSFYLKSLSDKMMTLYIYMNFMVDVRRPVLT